MYHYLSAAIFHCKSIAKHRNRQIKSSLLLEIQVKEHHYLYKHGCYNVQNIESCDCNDAEEWIHSQSKGTGI